MRIAVFASGSGTNLQALLDACVDDRHARVVLVASDRTSALALKRARSFGCQTHVFDSADDAGAMIRVLEENQIELIVLAGYLRLVPEPVVAAYDGRMINIHPALLPSFGGKGMYGLRVHQAVIDSGATISGPTIHLVSAEYDRGPIIAQWPVPVRADDTPEVLAARVLAIEHHLLPLVVRTAARQRRFTRVSVDAEAFSPADTPAGMAAAFHQPFLDEE